MSSDGVHEGYVSLRCRCFIKNKRKPTGGPPINGGSGGRVANISKVKGGENGGLRRGGGRELAYKGKGSKNRVETSVSSGAKKGKTMERKKRY